VKATLVSRIRRAIQTAGVWLDGASSERRRLVEHALRGAVTRGDVAALRLLGYGQTPQVSIDGVTFTPRRVRIGGQVVMTFAIKSNSARRQHLLVDVGVHFVKAHRQGARKVFKIGRVVLAPGERVELQSRFSLAIYTTRIPRPGRHAVDVIVNGRATRAGSFHVSNV
jgi:hypothetical protein